MIHDTLDQWLLNMRRHGKPLFIGDALARHDDWRIQRKTGELNPACLADDLDLVSFLLRIDCETPGACPLDT